MSAAPVESAPAPTQSATPPAAAPTAAPTFTFADPPAPSGDPAPSPGSRQDGKGGKPDVITLPPWMGELDAESAAYAKGKGWLADGKTFADVVKAHRSAESLIGRPADQVIAKPDWSKPESVAEFRKAIGVPESPEAYDAKGVQIPDGALNLDFFSKLAHRIGLPQANYGEFLTGSHEALEQVFAEHQKELELRSAAAIVEQEKGWGAAKEAKLQAIQDAITANGISKERYEALSIAFGAAEAREFLAGLSEKYGEHRTPAEGGGGFQITTPAIAQAEIRRLQSDPVFMADMDAGGTRAQAARERLNNLHRIAWSAE